MPLPLIQTNNLSKNYMDGSETPALSDISFSVDRGEFLAIMGPSGSGKSTLLHLLGFLDSPTSGAYRFDGKDASAYSSEEIARLRNKEFGFVFQAFNLLPNATVSENVKLPLLYSDTTENEWNARTHQAIGAVGLGHRAEHEASKLSGGEKQRAAIARALVNNPSVIFADEPTGNLDSKSGGIVMETLSLLNGKGHTIILVTHETYTAEYANRILTLRDGRVESDEQVTKWRHTKEFVK